MRLRDVVSRWLGGGPVEERAIDSVPWDVGGPSRPSLVSADQALGLVPVFAAVRLLAAQVASLPLQAYRKTGDTRQQIPTPSLFASPSVQGTLYDWLHRCVTSLALRGNAFGLVTQRDRDMYPTMVEWLHPDDVWVDDRQASGPGSFANPVWYWQGRVVPAEDLLHIPWFTVPGRVLGLSPIGACAATISTGLSAQNYTSDWFDNGAVPPGEFRNTAKTVNQVEADIISTRLNAAIRRRRPLVYGNDWEYKPISVSAHEAKFLETTKMTATQVAAMYGIPPEMIGGEAGGPLTYNTVEQNSLNFLKFTLRPWLECLEAAFFRLTPRPQYVKFNIDALLRSDLTTRMQAYQVARNIGLQSVDEQRALEDLPPLPGGRGQDYTPLEVLTKQAAAPSQPALRYADVVDVDYFEEFQRELPGSDAGPKGVDDLDEASLALLTAITELSDEWSRRGWDPAKHPRNPPGSPGGGRFRSMVDRLKDAIEGHVNGGNDGHPFDGFDREQLRRVAKARGITLKRGEDRDSIAQKLLDHLGGPPAKPAVKSPARKATGRPALRQAALNAAPVKLGTHGFERGIKDGQGDADALAFYRGHGYIEVNAYLRDGRALSADGKAKWTIGAIDAVMDQSPLTSDVQVHRGVGGLGMFGPAGRSGKSLVGMEFTDASYASATADPNVAREFYAAEDYGGRGAILNIRVPAGTKAVQLSDLGPKPKHDWELPRPPEQEAELLLQRGLTYRIVGDRVVNGIRHLDAEVMPQ